MLVLQRSEGESISIGENVKVTVTVIRGRYVKIGIDAPKDVSIVRSELEENLLKLVEAE
jgi:carbon storage regulator